MFTEITLACQLVIAAITIYLNMTGKKTISEYVWDAVDHTPMLIGFIVTAGLVHAKVAFEEAHPLAPVVVLINGFKIGHWCWRY